MADLPSTISFKAPRWLDEWLREFASARRRSRSQMARIIVEDRMAIETESQSPDAETEDAER
jgi:hypothetical protein